MYVLVYSVAFEVLHRPASEVEDESPSGVEAESTLEVKDVRGETEMPFVDASPPSEATSAFDVRRQAYVIVRRR